MSVYVPYCWCRPFGPRHVWRPDGGCPPSRVPEPLAEVGLTENNAEKEQS